MEVREGASGRLDRRTSDTITGAEPHGGRVDLRHGNYEVRVRARGSGTTYATNWSEPSAPLTVTTGACRAAGVRGETEL